MRGQSPRILKAAPTSVAYEVADWGVGELVLDDGRVAWHELPRPRPELQVTSCHMELVERLRAYFRGEAVAFDDVALDLEGESVFQRRCAEALRAVPRGEVVT